MLTLEITCIELHFNTEMCIIILNIIDMIDCHVAIAGPEIRYLFRFQKPR